MALQANGLGPAVKVVRRFIWEEDNNGNEGWIPMWIPRSAGFDATESMRPMLHDILEHKLCDKGTVAEECEAFGRLVAGRGVNGWIESGFRSTAELSLGLELGGVCARASDLGSAVKGTPNIKLMQGDDSDTLDFIRSMMPGVAKAYREELGSYGIEEADESLIASDLRAVFNRMVLGARDAKRRYGDLLRSMGPLFSYAETLRVPRAFEGEILTVKVDVPAARIKMIHHGYDRYPEQYPDWMNWAVRIYKNT
jgi:hypothetical protein